MCALSHIHETGIRYLGIVQLFALFSFKIHCHFLQMSFSVGKPTVKQLFQMHDRRPYPVIVLEAKVLDPDFEGNKKKAKAKTQEAPVMKQGISSEMRPT